MGSEISLAPAQQSGRDQAMASADRPPSNRVYWSSLDSEANADHFKRAQISDYQVGIKP